MIRHFPFERCTVTTILSQSHLDITAAEHPRRFATTHRMNVASVGGKATIGGVKQPVGGLPGHWRSTPIAPAPTCSSC